MGKMGKYGIGVVVAGTLLGLAALCCGDKDPTLSLRPPTSSGGGPVFSSSIESIPVVNSASTNQQSVYAKRPNSIHHSSAVASAKASSSPVSDQHASGGRNTNNPWYTGTGSGFGFDGFNGGLGGDSNNGVHSSLSTSAASHGGYYEHPPSQTSAPSNPSDGYNSASAGGSGTQGAPVAYYYQHYPSNPGSSHGGGWSGGEDNGGLFGDLSLPGLGGGGGGLAGLGGLKVLKIIAKGLLVLKPFLLLGLLFLISIPILFLLLPIPIITITGQPSLLRGARSSQLSSYLTQLSGKILNAEECLEKVICKLPHAPEKYQTRAKLIWDEYGSKMVKNARVSRGLDAYFESSSQKNKNLKCDQRFKCSNKYL